MYVERNEQNIANAYNKQSGLYIFCASNSNWIFSSKHIKPNSILEFSPFSVACMSSFMLFTTDWTRSSTVTLTTLWPEQTFWRYEQMLGSWDHLDNIHSSPSSQIKSLQSSCRILSNICTRMSWNTLKLARTIGRDEQSIFTNTIQSDFVKTVNSVGKSSSSVPVVVLRR